MLAAAAYHHIHGTLWHDRLEARDLAQALIAVSGILFQNVQRCVIKVLVSLMQNGRQALLDQGISAQDELRHVLERRPQLQMDGPKTAGSPNG